MHHYAVGPRVRHGSSKEKTLKNVYIGLSQLWFKAGSLAVLM